MVATIDDRTSPLSKGHLRLLHGLRGNFQTAQAQIGILHIADDHELISLSFIGSLLEALLHGAGHANHACGQKLSTGGSSRGLL